MAEIIPTGTTAATSDDFTLAAGDVTTVSITSLCPPAVPPCEVVIDQKIGSSYYQRLVMGSDNSMVVIDAPGTFRARRVAGASQAVGVDRV